MNDTRNAPLNVLFIAVDDLRPQTGAYGEVGMVTPALDAFAREGRLYTRHYVQVPTCGASRYALLTGQYPVANASYGNGAFSRYQEAAPPTSLPEWFREHGYTTVQMGKISHSPDGRRLTQESAGREGDPSPELPDAWDRMVTPLGTWGTGWRAFFGYAGGRSREPGMSPPTESAEVDDDGYPDGLMADEAVNVLGSLANDQKPFFLAVGFFKPHLPFAAPRSYWDRYRAEDIALARYRQAPVGTDPSISLHSGGEFFGNYGHQAGDALDPAYARHLRHGYAAATSYADAQVGKVLAALDRLGLRERTIVVVWGDHGYHLGEHGVWGKHTLQEVALRSALIVRTPGLQQPGRASETVVRSIDLYPTLTDLAALPRPSHLDGQSLRPTLDDPEAEMALDAPGFWKMNGYTGTTLRTSTHRFTRWVDAQGDTAQIELYDHQRDDDETRNVAAQQPGLVATLGATLDAQLSRRRALTP